MDHHDDVARGHRREVRRAQQRAAPGALSTGSTSLLPRVPGPVRPAPAAACVCAGSGQPRDSSRAQRSTPPSSGRAAARASMASGPLAAHPPSRRSSAALKRSRPSDSAYRFDTRPHERARALRPPPALRATFVRPADISPPDSARRGARVQLRVLVREDRTEFLALARESHRLHRPWTYPPERADQFDELYSRSRREDFLCLLGVPHGQRRDRGRVHDLPDRPRRLPVRLPRLLRPRAPRRPGPDARGARADPRPRVRAARPAPHRGEHPARQPAVDRARPAAAASGWRASRRATC